MLQSEPHLDVRSIQRNVLINQGVSAETCERHLRACVFFSQAFELPADVGRFKRSTSPGGFWEATLKWYLPQTAGQQITLRRQLTNFQVSKGSDPVQKFPEVEDHAELMRDAGTQVDVESVNGIYVAALRSEYDLEIRELSRNHVLDRNEIINLVPVSYTHLTLPTKA